MSIRRCLYGKIGFYRRRDVIHDAGHIDQTVILRQASPRPLVRIKAQLKDIHSLKYTRTANSPVGKVADIFSLKFFHQMVNAQVISKITKWSLKLMTET
jgi:hypothetical protein